MVIYEWDVETQTDGESDEFEDSEVLDHNHCDSFADCLDMAKAIPEPGMKFVIVLVRDDNYGRSWAYLEGGKLPEFFIDAYGLDIAKVPQRFHREVARATLAKGQK